MKRRLRAFVLFFALLGPGSAAADETAPQEVSAQGAAAGLSGWRTKPETNVAESGSRMAQGLGLCLALLFGGAHLYKRFGGPRAGGSPRRLRVVERLPLSAKTSLLLVECDGSPVLCSVGPDRVTVVKGEPPAAAGFDDSLEAACRQEFKYTA